MLACYKINDGMNNSGVHYVLAATRIEKRADNCSAHLFETEKVFKAP